MDSRLRGIDGIIKFIFVKFLSLPYNAALRKFAPK